MTDQYIRRAQVPMSDQEGVKRADRKAAAVVGTEKHRTGARSNGSSAQGPVLNRNGKFARNDAGNDRKGFQEKNPELRGSSSYLERRGGNGNPNIGILTPDNSNDYRIELSGNTVLEFDWSKFDEMQGSQRGNFRAHRAQWMMLTVVHNGHTLSLPGDTYWDGGEIPPALASPEGNRHLLTIYALRLGNGPEAPTEVHAGVWGRNMAPAAS